MARSEIPMQVTVHLNPTTWALYQPIKSSSQKLVLVALAQFADEKWQTHPSPEVMSQFCTMTKPTLQQNIRALIKSGYVEDTGYYRYPDGSNRVYQLVRGR